MIVDVGFKNEKEREEPFRGKAPSGGGKAKTFDRRRGKGRRDGYHKGKRSQPLAEAIRKAVGETPRALGPTMTPEKRMAALASGGQAAVVKLISVGGGRSSASNMIEYNSREAAMPLERENGELVTTKAQHAAMLDEWEHFFDKREPSKDVVTLTVTVDGADLEATKDAIAEVYKNQRFVMGEATDEEGRRQIVVVMSIASKKSGRIKITGHARDKVHAQLVEQLGPEGPKLTLEYGQAAHGVAGLTKELRKAAERAGSLSGPRDAGIDVNSVAGVAKAWERDLRSYGSRDVMHIAISAKAGTDGTAFLEAARDFLGHEFAGHKYAFALHGPHDTAVDKRTQESKATDHVHVHAMIVMRSITGHKLDPNIADFRRWRENIAHLAQQRGINMVATRRAENVNGPHFTKSEHEAVKANVAGEAIWKKVHAKQSGEPVMPRQAAGVLSAGQGRAALKTVLEDAQKSGNNVLSIEAIRLAKRHDAAFTEAKISEIELKRLGEASAIIASLNSLADMLKRDLKGDLDMAQRQVLEGSLDRYQKLVGKISDSMRGDPLLKASFDERTKPALDAIATVSEGNGQERDLARAERARAEQAQAAENAEAYERAARSGGDANAVRENAEKARQFRAHGARAGAAAESAEMNLRASGEPTQPIQERAEQIVRGDEYRPSVANSAETEDNAQKKKQEHVNAPRKPTKGRTR
ncbi:relaxase/mobilization nuclease domain-containing protein [Sinorhizobium fredii]|uniref:relaxase/mobilization nuclease domain-containing protein n=1 Tax=Rhizobium fredii TaxID=380 RepID=UPI00351844A4